MQIRFKVPDVLCDFSETFTASSKAWAWNPEHGGSMGLESFGIIEGIQLGVNRLEVSWE